MPATRYYSAEMVRHLPDDGNRYETVHGELLVSPSPQQPHQAVLLELALVLGNYLKGERIKGLFSSPADISWGPDTLVQPDLFVAAAEEVGLSNGSPRTGSSTSIMLRSRSGRPRRSSPSSRACG